MYKGIKEVKKCIKKLKLLRTGIAHFSFFGDDNWKQIDIQICILEEFLEKSKELKPHPDYAAIMIKVEERMIELGSDDNLLEDPYMQVYDWILGNTDEELVNDSDIKIFCKKKVKRGNKNEE
jgi:hypothetical protein